MSDSHYTRVGLNGLERRCKGYCDEWKPLEENYYRVPKAGSNARRSWCKVCMSERELRNRAKLKKPQSGRCRECEDMPWRRRHPRCTGCRKPYEPERITSPEVSLVGGQLAGLAEVCDG